MKVYYRSIFDRFSVCLLCGDACTTTNNLCPACIKDLSPLKPQYGRCFRCGVPHENIFYTENVELSKSKDSLCINCVKSPPHWDRLITVYDYSFPLSEIIQQFKYQNRPSWSKPLSEMLKVEITEQYSQKTVPDVVIPTPIHPIRFLERGFNQTTLIARPLCKGLNIPLDTSSCQRIKQTLPQTGLSPKERKKNVENCFRIHNSFNKKEYKHIAIVEDTVTTGATLNELSRKLKTFGINKIDVWCIARTADNG